MIGGTQFIGPPAATQEPALQFLWQEMNGYGTPEARGRFTDFPVHARIPAQKAGEFTRRLVELVEEFRELESISGEKVYGFIAGVYLTDLPELPGDTEE